MEEKILAQDAEWRVDQCAKDWRTWGGLKQIVDAEVLHWDASLGHVPVPVHQAAAMGRGDRRGDPRTGAELHLRWIDDYDSY